MATTGLGQQALVDVDDLPDQDDAGMGAEADLRELCEAFAAGRFGSRVPYAVEAPFSLLVDGRLVRGRIDAVYDLRGRREREPYDWQVVDWKTGAAGAADRPPAGDLSPGLGGGVRGPVDRVDAVFYHVRTDDLVRPTGLRRA